MAYNKFTMAQLQRVSPGNYGAVRTFCRRAACGNFRFAARNPAEAACHLQPIEFKALWFLS
jgi:hypothetical protein